ncbi:Pycsar system effector family protein [Marinicella meishanensis]|uniref:Pycsar system effector family protein n=1 Tax=Marinicella meishanensis TaxID=2873263 RepID=UPI001CBC3060|nr:Pycsar system effector family protein [Marinicella sp. NBU2979]
MNPADNDVIQTLRTAHQNQTQLNLMADQKANILIGTLALMFTVVLTRILSQAQLDPALLKIMLVFMLLELVPMVLTVMVLIPKNITGKQNTPIEEIKNPLFFGFFTRHSQASYQQYLQQQLVDNEAARTLLINDIYQIGQILRRKYRLLRWAYLFALLGILVAVVLWLITLL